MNSYSIAQEQPQLRPDSRGRALAGVLARPEWILLLAVSAGLYLWGLSKNGLANEYYAATVRSMASSWHNFLYGSFDMGGVMTVDKPPLAFWVQALFVKIFGYSGVSMLVPQALMGVAAVALTYNIVDRRFGRWPALAGGATLALTPMTVAISRHNNPDALLVLLSVLAVWFVLRALEDGRTRWLIFAGIAVGAAFTTKMGAALLVVPGLAAAYLWAAPVPRSRALVQLLIGGGVFIGVAAAWPLLMALTPAAGRPWISGTTDNSIWSLISQYNGLGRINGQQGGPGGGMGGGMGGGGGAFGGSAGATRLFNSALGPQISWLLGFAVVGGIATAWFSRLRAADPLTGWIIGVGGTFLTIATAFSFAKGIFHPYYTSQLAPFTAMLVGTGVGLLDGERDGGKNDPIRRRWAAAALVAGLVSTLVVLSNAGADRLGAWPVLLSLIIFGLCAVLIFDITDSQGRRVALLAGVAALLVAPAIWSVKTLGHATSGTFPAGGSAQAEGGMGGRGGPPGSAAGVRGGIQPRGFGGPPSMGTPPNGAAGPPSVPGGTQGAVPGGTQGAVPGAAPGGAAPSGGSARPSGGMFGGKSTALTAAIAHAKSNGGGMIGVESQSTAAPYIAENGSAVAGIGGFSGRESSVSVSWLADAVADARLRWFFVDGNSQRGGFSDGRTGSTSAMDRVAEVCTKVDLAGSSSAALYDCAGKAEEIRSGQE